MQELNLFIFLKTKIMMKEKEHLMNLKDLKKKKNIIIKK